MALTISFPGRKCCDFIRPYLPVFKLGSVVLAGAAVSNVDFIRPYLPVFKLGSVVLAGVIYQFSR